MTKKKITIASIMAVGYLFFPSPASAQVDIEDWFYPATLFPDMARLINVMLPNVLLFAGLVLFIGMIFAGFNVVVKGGSGDAEATAKARQTLTYAILGFAIVFGAYWIIELIEFLTGAPIFNPGF
jgi:hypothetical protein